MKGAWGDMQAELFKFQYDNTLSVNVLEIRADNSKFKFQYDNTLSFGFLGIEVIKGFNLNSNMIIL